MPLLARVYPNGKADINHFHAAGGLVHADAAQAVGKVPVDVADLGVGRRPISGPLGERLGDGDRGVTAAVHPALVVLATQALIANFDALLRKSANARVIGMTTTVAQAPRAYWGAYGATKAAQIAFARSWQAENQRLGPRVVIATPNPMPTAVRANEATSIPPAAFTWPR